MSRQQTRETDLGNDKIGGLLFKLALPAIMAQVINLLYNLVDRMYIGHINEVGPAALTGVGVTMPVIMAISAFAALVSMGGAPRASIMMGKGDREEAQRILGNCASMLIITAIVLTLAVQLFGREILLLFGASDNTITYAWAYVQIYSLGTIFVQLALGLNAFINAQGYAQIGMATVAIGAVCNIILDPVFIFGFHMGVQGAALATILSQAILHLDFAFPYRKKTIFAAADQIYEIKSGHNPALYWTGICSLCDAVYGEHLKYLF